MAQGYKCIARVVKTHGIKGEVVAVPASGLPPVLSQGLEVALVPPSLTAERWHKVVDVQTTDAGQLVTLSGIQTTNQAHELVGKYMLANIEGLEELESAESLDELLGLSVTDVRLGLLGSVEEIMLGAMQDIAVVRGERGEVMIPLVEDLIWYAEDERSLESELPYGLAPWDSEDSPKGEQ